MNLQFGQVGTGDNLSLLLEGHWSGWGAGCRPSTEPRLELVAGPAARGLSTWPGLPHNVVAGPRGLASRESQMTPYCCVCPTLESYTAPSFLLWVLCSSHNCLLRIQGGFVFYGAFEKARGDTTAAVLGSSPTVLWVPLTTSHGGGVRARSHEAPQVWATRGPLLCPVLLAAQARNPGVGVSPLKPCWAPRGKAAGRRVPARTGRDLQSPHGDSSCHLSSSFLSSSCVPAPF